MDVTINSLANIITQYQELKICSSTIPTSAQATNILSARGSKNLPKSVIRLCFLANLPSIASVIEAIINIKLA